MTKKNKSKSDEQFNPVTGECFSDNDAEVVVCTFPRFRSAYNHARPGHDFSFHSVGESMTKQEFKDSCDVNKIVEHFTKTGRLDAFREAQGQYLDFSILPKSYQESLNTVIAANAAFEALPAQARAAFKNDVSVFLHRASVDPEGTFGKRDAEGRIIKAPPLNAPTAPLPAETTAPAK